MRPEHCHYDTVENLLRKSIGKGEDFLFDQKLFRAELTRLWEIYDFPYEVCSASARCVCFVVIVIDRSAAVILLRYFILIFLLYAML